MLVKNESLTFGLTCVFISKKDANIDENDIVQSDPEIDKDSDEETLIIK